MQRGNWLKVEQCIIKPSFVFNYNNFSLFRLQLLLTDLGEVKAGLYQIFFPPDDKNQC